MKSKDFRSLIETASSVVHPSSKKELNESTIQQINEGFSENENNLMEAISEIIDRTEKDLNIKLTEDEIKSVTNFIIETAAKEILIEEVEKDVGFQLNEEEQKYVLQQLLG